MVAANKAMERGLKLITLSIIKKLKSDFIKFKIIFCKTKFILQILILMTFSLFSNSEFFIINIAF